MLNVFQVQRKTQENALVLKLYLAANFMLGWIAPAWNSLLFQPVVFPTFQVYCEYLMNCKATET